MEKLYVYEIEYRDDREGALRHTEITAKDSGEALDIAMREDYHFGSLLEITNDRDAREATQEEIADYNNR